MALLTVKNLVLSKNQSGKAKGEPVTILKGISTTFKSGYINVIMAPNGSGKTTFLNILFGRSEANTKTSGEILYDGKERDLKEWFSTVSYVEQDTFAMNDQTVESTIQFAIDITHNQSGERISAERLSEIYDALHLEKIRTKSVCAISGGERKRVMIAIELVMMKKILILDEPASDLDSYLALKLVMYLKKIAQQNDIMVILTIHQPSDQIYKKFDNILFILEGRVIFSGESSELIGFLASHKIIKPEDWTVSDFIFEAFYNKSEFKEFAQLKDAINTMMAGSLEKSNLIVSNAELTEKGSRPLIDWSFSPKQCLVLFKRSASILFKTKPLYMNILVLLMIVVSFIFLGSMTILKIKISDFIISPGKNFPNVDFDVNMTIGELISEKIVKKSEEVNASNLYRTFMTKNTDLTFLGSVISMSLIALNLNSGVFSMKEQLMHEVAKGFYNSSTLCVASFAIEFICFIVFAFGLFVALFIGGFKQYLGVSEWAGLFCLFGSFSFTSMLINTIAIHPIGSFGIVKSVIMILKILGAIAPSFMAICTFAGSYSRFLILPLRFIFGALLVIMYPCYFIMSLMFNKKYISIAASFEKYTEVIKEANLTAYFEAYLKSPRSYIDIFTKSAIDHRWMASGLILSLFITFFLTLLICSRVFTPRIAIKI